MIAEIRQKWTDLKQWIETEIQLSIPRNRQDRHAALIRNKWLRHGAYEQIATKGNDLT